MFASKFERPGFTSRSRAFLPTQKLPTGQERLYSLVGSSSPRFDTPNNVSPTLPTAPYWQVQMLTFSMGSKPGKLPPIGTWYGFRDRIMIKGGDTPKKKWHIN